ncbi:MAG TPA: PH domain-containing protein [Candidatus Bathyarchaeia archaeon]|nr:PH domain-containing protein [Candidatus Bathyarchaeia archaeon]
MSTTPNEQYGSTLWTGGPWILPNAIARTILIFVLAVVVVWLELAYGGAFPAIFGLPIWTLTLLLFLAVWLVSLVPLLVLRSSNRYTLRSGSLEVKTGIASTKNFVLSPSGFSDLEVTQSVIGRMVNYGDIIIYTQSERKATMKMVKDPNRVTSQIRDTMGRPIVRIEGQPFTEDK